MYTNIALIIRIVGLISCFRTITVLPSSRAALDTYEVLSFVLKKNLNASKPLSIPQTGKNLSMRLLLYIVGGNIGCQDTTSSWHSIGFHDGSIIAYIVDCF